MNVSFENTPDSFEILLVEDNPYDAELILRALRREGLAGAVMWLKDGAAALDFLFGAASRPPTPGPAPTKLVLLDLMLPKVDGLEVLRRIKADERTRTIPVVMMTCSREESDVLRSYNVGANSYIVKQVDFDKFTASIREVGLYWLVANQPPVLECGCAE